MQMKELIYYGFNPGEFVICVQNVYRYLGGMMAMARHRSENDSMREAYKHWKRQKRTLEMRPALPSCSTVVALKEDAFCVWYARTKSFCN